MIRNNLLSLKGLVVNVVGPLQRIGQCIILRRLICRELHMSAKISSNKLFLSVENLNQSILNDLVNRSYENTELVSEENVEKVNIKNHNIINS